MKHVAWMAVLLAVSLVAGGCTADRYARYERSRHPRPDTLAMLKTQDVISMSKAGVSDSLIISMLAVTESRFQLKPQDVIDLKNAGVSDRVIDAMLFSSQATEETMGSEEYGYAYPSYYWYPGYYPYWYYPYWYYPSLYIGWGLRSHYPSHIYRSAPRGGYYGGYYGGRGSAAPSGRHR